MFSSGIIRLLDFLIFFGYYLEYFLSGVEGSFSFLCSSLFCKRCVFIYLLHLSLALFILGVLGPWEFLGGPGHILSVCDSAVWSVGPVQLYSGTFLEWMAGLYRFFFLWLCCSGYGTVEMVRGLVRISFSFLQFAVSSLGGWMSVVGYCVP